MHLASIKIWLPGIQPRYSPFCFHFCFSFNKSKYKNKCGGDLPKAPTASSLENLSPNMLHNIDGPTCWRTGKIGTREGWPNLWFDQTNSDSSQFPLLPLQTMVCANTLLLLPTFLNLNEFMLITKNKLNEPSQSPYALHTLHDKLAYSYPLNFTLFLWTNTW